jgi:hypothetical protein
MGTYLSGQFTVAVAADGKTTITAWNVQMNFSWPDGGTLAIPQPPDPA